MYKVLVCDDDRDIVKALRIYLTAEGYEVLEAYDGRQALAVLESGDIHLVLMDIMMPVLDGISAVAALRESWQVPVILLTAKSESSDKVLGLNVGADDYITKPFDPVEMLARVRAQLRRYTSLGALPAQTGLTDQFAVGGIRMDDASKTVTLDGAAVELTPKEYDILKLLLQNPGRVYSSAEIYRAVWNETPFSEKGTVAVHVRHLREKLEINPAEPRYIKVVWGKGYKVEGDKA